ncbi:hypothetical protein [Streptomyces sp. NPDC086787]|uniref:hypothetical protein n=1 Tax=Streptomyces sp. NPDC086787 TaxID=3365759 RepID=UPI00380D92E8
MKGSYLQYRVEYENGKKTDWESAKQVVVDNPVTNVTPPPSRDVVTEGQRIVPAEVSHVILADEAVRKEEWAQRKTPGGLRAAQQKTWTAVYGTDTPTVTVKENTTSIESGNGKLKVLDWAADDDGLRAVLLVHINRGHVAEPHDLIELQLTRPFRNGTKTDDMPIDTIAVLTPDVNSASVDVEVRYTWAQLAKAAKLKGTASRSAFVAGFPQIGIQAVWYEKVGDNNSPNHWSGGVKQKDNTGALLLKTLTDEERKRTEESFQDDWNLSEILRDGRPVWASFKEILQPGKEMATTLEAESEFMVSEAQLAKTIDLLGKLMKDRGLQQKFGIRVMKAGGTKVSTDTYFDIAPSYPLLSQQIVLRRRYVKGDPAGTCLLALKGRTVRNERDTSERIRLAAQVQVLETLMEKPAGLAPFLEDHSTDNAFGRALHDAVSSVTDYSGLSAALVITAQREKFSFELENSTTIEFSADKAWVEQGGTKKTVYTIEFGVGHPGLSVQGGGTGGGTVTEAGSSSTTTTSTTTSSHPVIARPYHVPHDLENQGLFAKPDYAQFRTLRGQLLSHLFGDEASKLEPGGNKAHVLALLLGLIKKS